MFAQCLIPDRECHESRPLRRLRRELRTYTISDLLDVFSAAGLWIETAVEPQLSDAARRPYPHKQEWMNRYLGILIVKLRPVRDVMH